MRVIIGYPDRKLIYRCWLAVRSGRQTIDNGRRFDPQSLVVFGSDPRDCLNIVALTIMP